MPTTRRTAREWAVDAVSKARRLMELGELDFRTIAEKYPLIPPENLRNIIISFPSEEGIQKWGLWLDIPSNNIMVVNPEAIKNVTVTYHLRDKQTMLLILARKLSLTGAVAAGRASIEPGVIKDWLKHFHQLDKVLDEILDRMLRPT